MHFLVIPKQRGRLTQLSKGNEQDEQLMGHLMYVAAKVAKQGDLATISGITSCSVPAVNGMRPLASLWAKAKHMATRHHSAHSSQLVCSK